ncbi:gliding motility lipoprotein GldD [Corallibacter vietnamensis]|uniref:Gliding motility lipoprotein GldD n=1 Tax=Corallibacter vietnamensis TaxID=904130 RepID=A0ABP7GSN4_9FLAO
MKYLNIFVFILLFCLCLSCGNNPVPKPNAYLRLDYPEAEYQETNLNLPFTFEKNKLAENVVLKPVRGSEDYGVNLEYPSLKGVIYLTYKPVDDDVEHLKILLRDAQSFTQEHTLKADEIIEQVYENKKHKVYGMFYEVGGNAASQSQFYVTDSVNHFLTGSLYFYAKPNYDSILPAAYYLQKDIQHIMETVQWKQ